jgi:hypothetical protein
MAMRRVLPTIQDMNSIVGASPQRLARMAGGLYLINIVLGAFAIGVVPALLIGPDGKRGNPDARHPGGTGLKPPAAAEPVGQE